jgi:uncharacterized protein
MDYMMNKRQSYFLVLGITEKCNLDCSYCYAGGPGNRSMSTEVIKKSIDFALSQAESVHVQFSGGEPLLYMEGLRAAVDYLKSRQKYFILSLQTNGVALTHDAITFIKENNVALGISCDGFFDESELRFGDNTGSYSKHFLKTLTELSEYGIQAGLTCVVTSKNVDRINKLFDTLCSVDSVASLHLSVLRLKGNAKENQELIPDKETYKNSLNELILKIENYERCFGKSPVELRLLTNAKRNKCSQNSFGHCHLINDSGCFVNVLGEIYPCPSLSKDGNYLFGDIFNGLTNEQIQSVKNIFKGKLNKCYQCPDHSVCQGACFAREDNKDDGDFFKCIEFGVVKKHFTKERNHHVATT